MPASVQSAQWQCRGSHQSTMSSALWKQGRAGTERHKGLSRDCGNGHGHLLLTCLQRWLVHHVGSAASALGAPICRGSRLGYGREIGPRCRRPKIARQCGTAAGTEGRRGNPAASLAFANRKRNVRKRAQNPSWQSRCQAVISPIFKPRDKSFAFAVLRRPDTASATDPSILLSQHDRDGPLGDGGIGWVGRVH